MSSLSTLLLQIGLILLTAQVAGGVFRRFHQPYVIGEMLAGIMLGPCLFGWLAPSLFSVVFPVDSLSLLGTLSQIGLILFMFLIGMELNPNLLKGRVHAAVLISHVSILVPFGLGSLLALFLYPRLSSPNVPITSFVLFLGVSMSITAFPVLVRILRERNLSQSRIGAMSTACAAVDDVTAWSILGGIVLLVRVGGLGITFWLTILAIVAYSVFILLVAPHLLSWLIGRYSDHRDAGQNVLGFLLVILVVSASITEILGIHALFGAFLIGVAVPKNQDFVHAIKHKIEDMVVVLFLPLYFAYAGLRMSVGDPLGSAEILLYFFLILIVAIGGKVGGAMIASRISGFSWRESGAIGTLMNTRGLVELVALNIGLDIGVISPSLFTLMVFMALITTLMTTPVLAWIYPAFGHNAQITGGKPNIIGAANRSSGK